MNRKMLVVVLAIALTSASCSPVITPLPPESSSTVDWVSKAETVNELMLEADLVVRARVSKAPVTRVLRHELSVLDKNNNAVGTTISEALFSDTAFEVIRIYWGKPPINLTIAQTGGFDPTISNNVQETLDDPLYKVGEEYILFLVDISGDKVQAPNRELYRIVNPFGRYRVDGKKVFPYGLNPKSVLALNVSELEAQIELAIQELNK